MAFERRGFGWKKDPTKKPGEKPDFLARPKLGLAPPPETGSNRKEVLSILDQGREGACTAHAGTQIIRARMAHEGIVQPELCSRLFLYYLARAYDHDTKDDNGTFLRNIFQAAVKFGLPRESYWPYSDVTDGDDAPFRNLPPSIAFQRAFDQIKGASYHRIDTTGQERVDDVKRAIAAGYCVAFGTAVSNDFADNNLGSGPIPPPIGKSIAGNHALTLAEYDKTGVRGPNSWSEGWGESGWFTFSWDYIAWDQSDDFWLVDVVPKFSDDSDFGYDR